MGHEIQTNHTKSDPIDHILRFDPNDSENGNKLAVEFVGNRANVKVDPSSADAVLKDSRLEIGKDSLAFQDRQAKDLDSAAGSDDKSETIPLSLEQQANLRAGAMNGFFANHPKAVGAPKTQAEYQSHFTNAGLPAQVTPGYPNFPGQLGQQLMPGQPGYFPPMPGQSGYFPPMPGQPGYLPPMPGQPGYNPFQPNQTLTPEQQQQQQRAEFIKTLKPHYDVNSPAGVDEVNSLALKAGAKLAIYIGPTNIPDDDRFPLRPGLEDSKTMLTNVLPQLENSERGKAIFVRWTPGQNAQQIAGALGIPAGRGGRPPRMVVVNPTNKVVDLDQRGVVDANQLKTAINKPQLR